MIKNKKNIYTTNNQLRILEFESWKRINWHKPISDYKAEVIYLTKSTK